jgi:predicted RNA binding protein YcfA (HicA-like mRNA interferase family)
MPRLPRASGRRIARALEAADFDLVRMVGDHARLRNAETGRQTTVPLTNHPLPVGTIASILRQAGLSADELRRLLD